MPRKSAQIDENSETETDVPEQIIEKNEDEAARLTSMLAAVLNYLTDDDLEELDIESLMDETEGLREWWTHYQESNRKKIEEEIKKSLGEMSLEELKKIRETIKEKQD